MKKETVSVDRQKLHKYRVVILIIIAVIIILLILCLRCCDSGNTDNANSSTTETSDKQLDFSPAVEVNNSIQIPAMTGIVMKAGQLEQIVDFYNPKENNCYFVISLYLSDDTLIYKSEMLAPSEHLTDITLLQELQRGIYRNCRLVYNCFTLDEKTPLNGSNVVLEINSQ